MTEGVRPLLLALAAIVAVVSISVGIRDYVKQQKEAKLPASTPTAVDSKTPKKPASAKTKPARISATEADAPVTPSQPIWKNPTASAGAKMIDNAPNTRGQDADDEAMDRNNRVRNDLDAITACEAGEPLSLPNLTKPGDVDAPYYQNWEREYSCILTSKNPLPRLQIRAAAARK